MRIITGDECGLLKECIPEMTRKKNDADTPVAPRGAMPHVSLECVSRVDPDDFQARSRGVVDMTFVSQSENACSFAALRKNGSVELWESEWDSKKKFGNYDKAYSTKNIFGSLPEGPEIVKPLMLGAFPKESRLCAGNSLGSVSILDLKNGKVVDTYDPYKTSKQGKIISYTPGNDVNTQLATAMACDVANGRIAVGGRERETTLLDLATGKPVFKAKNLPPDPQTLLQQPVWPTSILFLSDTNTMAVGTAYKQLRLYDVREDSRVRRPTALTPEGLLEYRVTCLCQVQDHEIAVGDAAGYIYSVDLRTLGKNPRSLPNKNMGRFVGPAGSVRQLKKHPTLPRLAAVGLDRMLRIYDTENRRQLDCVYLKQRLNCALFGNDDTWGEANSNPDDDDWNIDQEDIVQDYIDSDDEQARATGPKQVSEVDMDEESDEEQGGNSTNEDSDQSVDEDASTEVSDQSVDEESLPSGEEQDSNLEEVSEQEDDSEGSDEKEIIVKAPKKRRKR